MRRYQNNTPRELTARFNSVCPETGKAIKRGDACVYFPASRKAYHMESESAQDWLSQATADAFCLADANW